MNVEINYLAVLLATLSSFVVGMIWYSRGLYGTSWAKMVGLNDKQLSEGMPKAMGMSFVASLLMAYVVAHVTYLTNSFYGNSFLRDALCTAFVLWLGVSAATIVTHDAFEKRRKKLTLINVGNQLLTLLAMGLIIGLLRP